MNDTARQLRDRHQLKPHPEGGWYRELHRSAILTTRADGSSRTALTTILFLLCEGDVSCWHRVQNADEAWVHCAGAPLDLWCCDPDNLVVETHQLQSHDPVRVIPAGHWQAARSRGAYSFVSCCVGPGFDFADFEMARNHPIEQRPKLPYPELI